MSTWRPDKLLKVLLGWSAVTFIIFWLPAVRGLFDGPSYEWSFLKFQGAGTSGDYWFPVLGSALAIGFLALGYRGARRPFRLLLLAWHGSLAAGAVWAALTFPGSFRFRGDTLGVDVSLAFVGPVVFGGFFLLALFWALQRSPGDGATVPRWNARNRLFTALVLGLVPIQFVLLRFGPPHGTSDRIGVLLTMLQWGLISAALYPLQTRTAPAAVREPARTTGVSS